MTWIITATGAEYHLAGHGPRPVKIEDIAHQLALINRFHGATNRPYSVAEHSLLVREIAARNGAGPVVQLAALLHDAHEAYTNDLASPAKQAVNSVGYSCCSCNNGHAWATFELVHQTHVRNHFGLRTVFATARTQIREWDLIALATERRDLTAWANFDPTPWAILRDGTDTPVQPLEDVDLNAVSRCARPWTHWKTEFLDQFEQLQARIQREHTRFGAAFDERAALIDPE